MNLQVLAGSPRLLRNLNEKAVLERLLDQNSLTRTELEAFTGLSKPAMSDLLRRLEGAGLIRRDGSRAGSFGPKAGLWALHRSAAFAAGVDVTARGISVAIADITGKVIAARHVLQSPGRRYEASALLLQVLGETAAEAGLAVNQIDQVVVGLPGIVDSDTGHLRKGRQLPDWQGFDIPSALMEALGHRRVLVENDVNLVAIEETIRGAAVGVQSFVLFWIGEGVGGGLVLGGKLIRGSTGSAGELGGTLVPSHPIRQTQLALVEDLLSAEAVRDLLVSHGFAGRDAAAELREAARDLARHGTVIDELGYRVAAALSGAIGMLDPDMVVLGGDIGVAGGKALAQRVVATLATLPIAVPQIVPSAVGDNAVRAGAIELALEHARERVFTGGSAARGLP